MRFSIVTPVLNRVSTIRPCIESVARQMADVEAVQHIIVDGGSDDGTLEVLDEYPHLEVFGDPVRGIYRAMNSGLSVARHDVVAIVNSDDILEPGALVAVSRIFADNPNQEAVAGRAVVERIKAGRRTLVRRVPARGHFRRGWDQYFHGPLGINAHFFKRRVLDAVGAFNTEYAICSDRELLIRMKLRGIDILPIDNLLYRYLEHEGSATLNAARRQDLKMREEHIAIAQSYLVGGKLSPRLARRFRGWIAAERARNTLALLKDGAWRVAWREARLGSGTSVFGFTTFVVRRAVSVPLVAACRVAARMTKLASLTKGP